ncbi:MAG TPA: PIG-L family deacetylase [bacterium]|nr:PIG-L family deacetylase [bacterium]
MKKVTLGVLMFLLLTFSVAAAVPTGDPLAGVTPGPDGKIDVLTIFPHQDDESIFVGGTMLKMKRDPRVRVHILCMTMGDMTDVKDKLGLSQERMGQIRMAELQSAAADLDADEVIQLHYHDQGLASQDQDALVEEVLGIVEKVGAEVLFTYGPDGMTGHIDHITLSKVVTRAWPRSSAQKLYYVSLGNGLKPFHHMLGGGAPLPATMKVDVRDERKLKELALDAHASQRHFSSVGYAMEMMMTIRYEYFTDAGPK